MPAQRVAHKGPTVGAEPACSNADEEQPGQRPHPGRNGQEVQPVDSREEEASSRGGMPAQAAAGEPERRGNRDEVEGQRVVARRRLDAPPPGLVQDEPSPGRDEEGGPGAGLGEPHGRRERRRAER